MRVLVDYWASDRSGQEPTIAILQSSPGKGLLFGRLNKEYMEVGGYCSACLLEKDYDYEHEGTLD